MDRNAKIIFEIMQIKNTHCVFRRKMHLLASHKQQSLCSINVLYHNITPHEFVLAVIVSPAVHQTRLRSKYSTSDVRVRLSPNDAPRLPGNDIFSKLHKRETTNVTPDRPSFAIDQDSLQFQVVSEDVFAVAPRGMQQTHLLLFSYCDFCRSVG